jgi:glycosyltransferase involved in cell wall biosynthesis
MAPSEVVIHDDFSPNQSEITNIVESYRQKFINKDISFVYFNSTTNKGYDGSLRFLIASATSEYILFIGNDDILMPECVSVATATISLSRCNMYSRNFFKITGKNAEVTGKSTFCKSDTLYIESAESPAMAFRLCSYFGGLIFAREWANSLETNIFDGTLYYQYHLALNAFISTGIYCISTPIVGALTDGVPLFSETDKSGLHITGRYAPKARAKMWSKVLEITTNFDLKHDRNFLGSIQYELKNRMAFHIMEMYCSSNRSTQIQLANELLKINLFWSPISTGLWVVNFILGSKALSLYNLIRSNYQRV